MKTFKIKYYDLSTGMEGIADEDPEMEITAPDKDLAIYVYEIYNGDYPGSYREMSFNDFMKLTKDRRERALTISEIEEIK